VVGLPRNVFVNKYGQNLAVVQIAREKRMEDFKQKRLMEEQMEEQARAANAGAGGRRGVVRRMMIQMMIMGQLQLLGYGRGGSKLKFESEKLAEGDDGI